MEQKTLCLSLSLSRALYSLSGMPIVGPILDRVWRAGIEEDPASSSLPHARRPDNEFLVRETTGSAALSVISPNGSVSLSLSLGLLRVLPEGCSSVILLHMCCKTSHP